MAADWRALERTLRTQVDAEVRFDAGSRALYATDSSNYRQVPIGVVVPRTIDAVIAAVQVCREHDAPLLARGGGTSLAGQCCNTAVILDFSKYLNRIVEVNADHRLAYVQPGVVLDHLREQAEQHGLTFAPDPATHNRCTLGGMIGNNSCGVHSLMAGKTVENVEELDILTYDGLRLTVGATTDDAFERQVDARGRPAEIFLRLRALRDRYETLIRKRFPNISRRVSGYNLDQLLPEHGFHVARALVGSEGTCVTVLGATLRLVPSPPGRSLLVLGYRDVAEAADDVMRVLATQPIGLEGIDDVLVDSMKRKGLHPQNLKLLPPGRGWLLVEFGADTQIEADEIAQRTLQLLTSAPPMPSGKVFADPNEKKLVWQIRESGLASAFIAADDPSWEGWEDAAVPPERLGTYLRELRALYERYSYKGALYGHFGEGCVHTRTDFDLVTRAGIAKFRAFVEDAADLVLRLGGSFSGEHGDGQARGELLEKMFGPDLMQAFRQFKAAWDPTGRMNPGKLIDALPITQNLRLGTGYRPSVLDTHFRYPNDRGSFAHAQLRCVGVGACRKQDSGTMCPSYMVTLEEKHSTRGRARLLFEMLQGETLQDGWRNRDVKEALDLCLACKGCRHECPTSVDMATYKAEFLSHYYQGRVRPRAAYAMGLLPWWVRLGARAPGLANAIAGSEFGKRLAGIAPARAVPRIARVSFVRSFEPRPSTNRPRVILWPDTFNNYFQPRIAHAAAAALTNAGFDVTVPHGTLCCGRPLYDWGFLGLARKLLRRVLRALRADIEAGVPVVVLEPSCAAVFRDELVNLFPSDIDALRLSRQTFLLAEFLDRYDVKLPKIRGRALVQRHCHHKAVMRMSADENILRRLGLEFDLLDAGCCGMAGAFGFEHDKYDVSVRIGERALLPAVRAAPEGTLIIADGFSCREQITQLTDKPAHHLAEVLLMK
ncbi:MAG TPA: FAD-binding and (Fe-S)-binding domain-containing protein [Longimicrobiales bacterium]|nr:FAD-binding and (Fe-S)-binding domain-containing protein [Longimicrobiales bacterium]